MCTEIATFYIDNNATKIYKKIIDLGGKGWVMIGGQHVLNNS